MGLFTLPIRITWPYGTGSPGANVWHFRTTGAFNDDSDAEAMIDAVHDFYSGIVTFYRSDVDIDFDGVVTGMGADSGESATFDTWHVDGTATGDALSSALQMCISWGSGSGGRSGRGRTFIGPLPSTIDASDGVPVQAAADQLLDAANALIETSDSFANGAVGVWSPTDGVLRDFTVASVRRQFAILRSRRD